ncbi:MAG: restriction endonuclease subunit S [Selenomonas bovis]|nr:restriction endonuclease subunit S [Selenomonas bovis]MCI6752549.1 restriction endonuclease subunit S [Selenomonas bovis]
MSEKKTPAIRFEGFMDEWEQHEFGDIAKFINGRAYAQNELLPTGKYKVLRVGNFYTNESWYYSNLELVDKYYAKYGDLLYTWSATFGPHIWHGEKVIYHYHIWKVDVSNRLDKYFAMQLLEQDKHDILSGYNGSTMAHITKYGMEKKRVTIPPNIEEQKQLGIFLGKLDNLIALHQHKLTKLQLLKKSMLTKMFPKDGARVPEIRFQGFHGDWSYCKIFDLAPLQRGFDLPTAKMKPGKYPVIMSNGIGGYHSEYKVHGPGVITGRSGTIGKLHYTDNNYWPHNTTLWVTDFKGNFPKFIYYLYSWLDLSKFEAGSGVPTLNRNDVHDTKVYIPVIYEEQQKIADYFDGLENIIVLHQKKLSKLQKIKQAMLSKLFV